MQESIKDKIHTLSSISLDEMNSVALMKRTDTKFIVHESQLISILEFVKDQYKALEIDNNRVMTYSSLYFDTTHNKFFHDHHNGRNNRTKIRIRKYVESSLSFLEIKQKNGKGETNKSRLKIDGFETNLSKSSFDFITKTTLQNYDLSPSLWNSFNRTTLVSNTGIERVTIDSNLSYTINGLEKKYDDLVIIEVKQERINRDSAIVKALKLHKKHPYSISKYCIGMIGLYPNLKYNSFKEKLIKINKLIA